MMILNYGKDPKQNRRFIIVALLAAGIILALALGYIYGWDAVGRYMRSPQSKPTYGTADRVFRSLP
jgi:hypothetical protein